MGSKLLIISTNAVERSFADFEMAQGRYVISSHWFHVIWHYRFWIQNTGAAHKSSKPQ